MRKNASGGDEFASASCCKSLNMNQIEDPSHTYDLNGNLQRFSGKDGSGHQVGAGWDERNRMRVFFAGDPRAGGSPGESYLYDASSYRLVTFDKTGVPRFSLRNGAGQALSEYLLPRGGADGVPELDRDFVYGAGQLLVERQVAAEASQLFSASPMKSGDDYALTATGGDLEASYALDISSPSGYRNQVSGIDVDASGNFPLAETELSPGETNFLRIRMEDGAGTPYSRSISIAYDDAMTATSPNQIRSMSISRSGTDLVVRWNLLEENGKPTLIYFTRADTGVSYVVCPGPLAPGTTVLTLDSQALGTPCGSFSGSQQESDGSMTDSSVHAQIGVLDPGGLCTNPGDPPPPGDEGLVFNETFHHRDHLGSLRVATDEAGWPVMNGRLDYYPFGMRMDTGLPDATRRHYTGHEHDPDTGLEYMLARYDSTGKGRFLAVDPARDVSAAVPVSWNRYAYVRNNPVGWSDPTGAVEENQATPVTGAQSPSPDEAQLGDALTERGEAAEAEKAVVDAAEAARILATLKTIFTNLGENAKVLATSTTTNCFGHVVGSSEPVAAPAVDPDSAPKPTASLDAVMKKGGFKPTGGTDFSLQEGVQKAVVYAKTDKGKVQDGYTHAALQEADGTFTSVVGNYKELISHATPGDLTDGPGGYGEVVAVYERSRPK